MLLVLPNLHSRCARCCVFQGTIGKQSGVYRSYFIAFQGLPFEHWQNFIDRAEAGDYHSVTHKNDAKTYCERMGLDIAEFKKKLVRVYVWQLTNWQLAVRSAIACSFPYMTCFSGLQRGFEPRDRQEEVDRC